MNEEDLNKIYNIKTIKELKAYLNDVKLEYNNLSKKGQKEYVNNLNILGFTEIFGTSKNKAVYSVYNHQESLKKLILKHFISINEKNFSEIINDLINLFDEFSDVHKTKRITKNDIKKIFEVINTKIPKFDNIFKGIKLEIMLINATNKYYNSLTIPTTKFNKFIIVCSYMKDNEDYKKGINNPIYIFLHELGHIICWILTKENKKIPANFFEDLGIYFKDIDPNNPDFLEVFADSFAMAIMYNTELDIYNPFKILPEQLFIDLEKYYTKVITAVIDSKDK